jgi:hypothetical protein
MATSAEVLQELLHVYLPVAREQTLDAALRLATDVAVIWPVDASDVLAPGRYPEVCDRGRLRLSFPGRALDANLVLPEGLVRGPGRTGREGEAEREAARKGYARMVHRNPPVTGRARGAAFRRQRYPGVGGNATSASREAGRGATRTRKRSEQSVPVVRKRK